MFTMERAKLKRLFMSNKWSTLMNIMSKQIVVPSPPCVVSLVTNQSDELQNTEMKLTPVEALYNRRAARSI